MSDTSTAVAEVKTAFNEFRKANDEALQQKADKGYVDAELQERIGRLEAAMDERIDKIDRAQQLNNAKTAPAANPDQAKLHEQFETALRLHHGNPTLQLRGDALLAYEGAFDKFLRAGKDGLSASEMAALQTGFDPRGGTFMPPAAMGRMVRKVFESSPMRQIASVETIAGDRITGVIDDNEAGFGWVGETESRPETGTPDVGEWEIEVHEAYAEPKATQKMLDDAGIDVEGWVVNKGGSRITRAENTGFFTGNGVKKPRGILTYTNVETDDDTRPWGEVKFIKSGADGAFAGSNPGDRIIDLIFDLKDAYMANARFLMRRSTEAAARKLKDGDGNYLWVPDFTQGRVGVLAGHPITRCEDMPVIASDSLSIAFGDFREAYLIVDRIGFRVLVDPYTNKPYVKFYITRRVGGGAVNTEAYRLMKFAA